MFIIRIICIVILVIGGLSLMSMANQPGIAWALLAAAAVLYGFFLRSTEMSDKEALDKALTPK
jgi:hypothetical protein